MYLGGTLTTPFYPLLLWIIFGHGFRYGRWYLYLASALSLFMFIAVVAENRDWQRFPVLTASLILALVVLPAYVSVLLAKLEQALERAQAASRAKSRFLATMSHEFRTPLNAVIGTAELLARTRLDREQRDMVTTIRVAADGLLSLVQSVLDFARIESGRMELEREPWDLDRELAALRAMFLPLVRGKGLWLRLRLDPAVPSRLVGSCRAVHQVLVNLLANAVKFTETGGITLSVGRVRRGGREALQFSVRDTGIGIPEEAQERIFERFTQADEKTGERYGGTGLGLAISRELVRLMGGEIGVESRPGEGATFTFHIPLEEPEDGELPALPAGTVAVLGDAGEGLRWVERLEALGLSARVSVDPAGVLDTVRRAPGRVAVMAVGGVAGADLPRLREALDALDLPEPVDIVALEAPPDAPVLARLGPQPDGARLRRILRAALVEPEAAPGAVRERKAADAGTPGRGCRVLLAEDNPVNQKVVARLLEHAGHEVTVVGDGHGVIERLEHEVFDVVVLDVNMPDLSGPETLKMLRFMYDPAELPPFVALSADATRETREACLSLGFSRYLTKPVRTDELLAALDELVPPERRHGPLRTGQPTARAAGAESAGAGGEAAADDGVVVPHPRLAAAPPVLDERRLAGLAALDPGDGFLRETVEEFLRDGAGLVEGMKRAAATGDVRTYRDCAHALRSSAAHIGAEALYRRCLEWRGLDDHALALRMRGEAEEVAQEFARAEAALRAFLAGRQRAAGSRTGSA
ncbi:Sensory/regulatory protein RpfC [bacterium HR39]|nr:Sensory/regulatory protein RpfC [bacterium HR39]